MYRDDNAKKYRNKLAISKQKRSSTWAYFDDRYIRILHYGPVTDTEQMLVVLADSPKSGFEAESVGTSGAVAALVIDI